MWGLQSLCGRPARRVTLDLPKSPLTGTEAILALCYRQGTKPLAGLCTCEQNRGCNQMASGLRPAPAQTVALELATWAPALLDGHTARATGGNACRILVYFAFLLFPEKLNVFSYA